MNSESMNANMVGGMETKGEANRQSHNPYDPSYDPLTRHNPGTGQAYAPTYWIGTAGTPPEDDGPILSDTDADVVIIGSGYTGLTAVSTSLNITAFALPY